MSHWLRTRVKMLSNFFTLLIPSLEFLFLRLWVICQCLRSMTLLYSFLVWLMGSKIISRGHFRIALNPSILLGLHHFVLFHWFLNTFLFISLQSNLLLSDLILLGFTQTLLLSGSAPVTITVLGFQYTSLSKLWLFSF